MVVFTLSVLDRKHPFWVNLVQKIKIVSLIRSLIPRLIRICRILWWCSLFLFYTEITIFYCLCDRTELENQLSSKRLFHFVAVSASMDCFCGMPSKFLNDLKPKQTFYFI